MLRFYLFPFLFLIAAFGLLFESSARAEMVEIMDDHELASIQARGFYFRLDLSLEAFTDASTAPQVVVNTGEPFVFETDGTAGGGLGSGNINLSGNAQGNLNALINIIGANSVINVGLNIINIQNSAGDYIYLTNGNAGMLGGQNNEIGLNLN